VAVVVCFVASSRGNYSRISRRDVVEQSAPLPAWRQITGIEPGIGKARIVYCRIYIRSAPVVSRLHCRNGDAGEDDAVNIVVFAASCHEVKERGMTN